MLSARTWAVRPTRAVQIPLSSAASQLCDLELVPPTLGARDPPPTRTLQDVGWFSNSPGGGGRPAWIGCYPTWAPIRGQRPQQGPSPRTPRLVSLQPCPGSAPSTRPPGQLWRCRPARGVLAPRGARPGWAVTAEPAGAPRRPPTQSPPVPSTAMHVYVTMPSTQPRASAAGAPGSLAST